MRLDEIDRMVRQANPVPDPTALDAVDGLRRDDATRDVDAPAFDGTEVVVVDVDPTRRRRWLVIAAAAAALVVVAGVLVRVATDDEVRTQVPAGPATSPTTVPPRLFQGADQLPPLDAPLSTPEIGELVAAMAFSALDRGEASINLYADGRVIWLGDRLDERSLADDVPGRVVEQRLTPDAVESVRSAFLATGLFSDPATSSKVFITCACVIRVRDGGQLLSTDVSTSEPNEVDPTVDAQVEELIEYVSHLPTLLPPSSWADREIRAYVPSRYQVCVYGAAVEGTHHPLPDPFAVLSQAVPAPLAQLLAGAAPCVELTRGDARAVAEAFDDAGLRHQHWPPRLQFTFVAPEPDPTMAYIDISPVMPDGGPPMVIGS